jgi:hypothetical protein
VFQGLDVVISPVPCEGSVLRGEMTDLRDCEFDGVALWQALDAQRAQRGLTWSGVTREFREAEAGLAAQLGKRDHPIATSTIAKMAKGQPPGCHFALGYLRWLGATPESLLTNGDPLHLAEALPETDTFHRLRWDVPRLAATMNERRIAERLTWKGLADILGVYEGPLSSLTRLKYGTSMTLAMKVTQWLGCSAASFTYAAEW